MALAPPQSKEDWLYATVFEIANKQELLMATLNEVLLGVRAQRQENAELKTAIQNLQTSESQQTTLIATQSGIIGGLAASQASLIALVEELRNNQSPEEQAIIDEAMTEIAGSITETAEIAASIAAADVGSASQSATIGTVSTRLSELAAQASAAAGGTTPPTPTP